MEVDITKIQTYWITIESATDRHEKMNSMFETLGFDNTIQLNGTMMDKTDKSFMGIQKEKSHLVAECHAKALSNPGPIIVLEDDVWYTDNFDPIVHYEEDTDAVYLGTSIWGMVGGVSTGGGTRFHKINEDIVKPLNMLGVHSVLYLSEKYKKKTMENMLGAKDMNMIMDEAVAIDMQNHNILCYSRPRFYQQDGHNDVVTTIPLEASECEGGKMKTYSEIVESEDFLSNLSVLNGNLRKSLLDSNFAPVIIGNLFYDHIQKKPPFYESPLNKECDQKRRRFFKAAQQSNNMFEIGLNGGHSTFLALMSNPKINVTANDLAEQFIVHPEVYTIEAAKTLKNIFGHRFNFIKGNCVTEVPRFVASNKNVELDLLHIDGEKDTYKQDFLNLMPLLKDGSLVIFDDFQQGGIRKQAEELMDAGFLYRDDEFPQMDLVTQRLTNEILRYKK